MLEVIQREEQLAVSEECGQHLDDRTSSLLPHPERACDRGGHKRRIGEGRQLDKERAIRKHPKKISGGLQREPRLAHPTRSGQGHQVNIFAVEEILNLSKLPLPAEQGCRLKGEVVRAACKRLERGKVSGEIRVEQLIDPLRLEQIAQPVVAQIEKVGPCGKGVAGQLLHRLRQQNLAAMSG
ncbi:MAG: hypothetical protein K0S78_6291 [Thermomicrobiales bacterium]|nr:hypothetical protein [Thermomicrobiales bacterium]